jgi:PAS domain S-box-containing protein
MQAPASICVLKSPAYTFDLINPQFQKLLGNRPLINQSFAEALPDIAQQGYMQILDEVQQSGKLFFGKEMYVGIDRNGTGEWDYGYFNFIYQPIIDTTSKVESIFIFAYEVTQQVDARKTIEEYATKVRQILDSIPQIAWTADAKGKNTYSNNRWYEYTGAKLGSSSEDGTTLIQFLHPDDIELTIENWKQSLQHSQPLEIECRIRRKDGVYRWMLNRALPIKNSHHEITEWVGTCTDIHDQKTAIEELAKAQLELETKNEELTRVNVDLDNFVYTASHDLRSPITNLDGLQQMLRERLEGKLDDTAQKLMEHMTTSVTKLNRTINDLTEIVKVQKEKDQAWEEVDFQEVLEDVQADVQPLIVQSQARIDVNFDVQTIDYARKHLRSILYNLLSNAIKYRSPKHPLHIRLHTKAVENKVCLSVSDNGLGIDQSQVDKIFMMFKRAHTHVEGSGIGLYMVKRIVENYGGQIKVESKLGVGTTFNVYFKNNKIVHEKS